MLVHHDSSHHFWVDLNASKEFGFGAILFHVRQGEKEVLEGKWPKLEPIFFSLDC